MTKEKIPCDICGRMKDPEDLISRGQHKICWLCDHNQTRQPRGKEIKTRKAKNSGDVSISQTY